MKVKVIVLALGSLLSGANLDVPKDADTVRAAYICGAMTGMREVAQRSGVEIPKAIAESYADRSNCVSLRALYKIDTFGEVQK